MRSCLPKRKRKGYKRTPNVDADLNPKQRQEAPPPVHVPVARPGNSPPSPAQPSPPPPSPQRPAPLPPPLLHAQRPASPPATTPPSSASSLGPVAPSPDRYLHLIPEGYLTTRDPQDTGRPIPGPDPGMLTRMVRADLAWCDPSVSVVREDTVPQRPNVPLPETVYHEVYSVD